jgi:carbon monoxide dehydrogenase subunit G
MPEASFSHTATVLRPRRDVWDRLQDARTWSEIGPVDEVWDPAHDEYGSLLSYRWSTTVGPRRYEGTARRIDGHAPDRMSLALDGGEISGVLTTQLAALSERETQITVDLSIQPHGLLSIMFFGVVSDVVGRGLPTQVEHFAENCR